MVSRDKIAMDVESNNKLHALLAKGYFPRELPITFTTQDFGRHAQAITDEWKNGKVFGKKQFGKVQGTANKRRDSFKYDKLSRIESEQISKPKRGFERRNLHLTHPVPQSLLAREMAENWRTIKASIAGGTYSDDPIDIKLENDRGIGELNFRSHQKKKSYIEATSDWIVKTDISRFYPSIYTHSIPWALYGKEKVKKDLSAYDGSLGDRLDLLVRSCSRNQTIGIPIGPETSRIIAEIISTRIESKIRTECPELRVGSVDRLQDDWFIGLSKFEDAEKILSKLRIAYGEYGLEINGSKTNINRITDADISSWFAELGAFLSHNANMLSGARLREFLALCARLQKIHPDEPVISYALSVLEGLRFQDDDIADLESFLLKALSIAPLSADRICYILINIAQRHKNLSSKRIEQRLFEFLDSACDKNYTYEIIWAMHTLRGLRVCTTIKSGRILQDFIERCSSSVICIIALDLKSKGLFKPRLPTQAWEAAGTKEAVRTSWNWLLNYEGIRHGWLSDPLGLSTDAFFEPMLKRSVVFYDPKRNAPTLRSVVAKKNASRRTQDAKIKRMLDELRGLSHQFY